jgi:hypothetical protein
MKLVLIFLIKKIHVLQTHIFGANKVTGKKEETIKEALMEHFPDRRKII